MTLVIRLAGAEASSRDTAASMLTEEGSHLTYHMTMIVTMTVIVMV